MADPPAGAQALIVKEDFVGALWPTKSLDVIPKSKTELISSGAVEN
jgi:hypothetical protein